MKSAAYRNNDLFLRNRQFMIGAFDMPFVYSQNIDTENLELLAFSNTRHEEKSQSNKSKTIHFFLDDYKFDEVWNDPEPQIKRLAQYKQVMSPDFSVYSDMPEPLQIYNTFRNRWCASLWQFNELVVIPTLSWGDKSTFDFCFDGIEKGCTVAVSTVGAMDDETSFKLGYKAMCERIQPPTVINYGNSFPWMSDFANLISLPYNRVANGGEKP